MATEIEQIEDLMLSVAEGDGGALAELQTILQRQPDDSLSAAVSESERQRWHEAAEMVFESELDFDSAPMLDLIFHFARLGYDSPGLRDRLAEAARRSFPNYPDPGGLLSALGIRKSGVAVRELPGRWRMFAALEEGGLCCHPRHGMGVIEEIDGLANEARVRFERTFGYSLERVLDDFHLIKNDSPLAKLAGNNLSWSELEKGDRLQTRQALEDSFLPPVRSLEVVRRCLAGVGISEKRVKPFLAAYSEKELSKEVSEKSESESGRRLSETRSLQELKLVFEQTRQNVFSDGELEHIEQLLNTAAERREQALDFAGIILQFWEGVEGAEWLQKWARENGARAVCWNNEEFFIFISDRLPARRLLAWFLLTVQAIGPESTARFGQELPLKSLPQMNRALVRATGDKGYFVRSAADAVRSGKVSADLIVWLWHNADAEGREAIRDAKLVFQALSRQVRGSFIKANRELRNLLGQNENFQRFLMRDGEPAAINRAVSCVRNHGEALDSGEKQSLLVRFARLFPEVRDLVEKRTPAGTRNASRTAAGQAVTSVRSYEARKRELQEVVKNKIPANSRAIAHARGYGDLRENAEYKAAKEEQSQLLARREQMEESLQQVKPTDFNEVSTPDKIVPGCTVRVRSQENGETREYHILGCWDSNPEENIISYETPLGRSLLGRGLNDSVDTPIGKVDIEEISPVTEALRQWLSAGDE